MGLIHSRARKARDRAEAAVLREQAIQMRTERVAASDAAASASGDIRNPWRQPTLGEAFAVRRRNKELRAAQERQPS
jgi:hypothetical protein